MKGMKYMNIVECYAAFEGDYEHTVLRLSKEERVVKYIRKFAENDTMDKLRQAYREENAENIFLYAHSLKGICDNVGLTKLEEAASGLTECYRNGGPKTDPEPLMACVEKYYRIAIDAIRLLDA